MYLANAIKVKKNYDCDKIKSEMLQQQQQGEEKTNYRYELEMQATQITQENETVVIARRSGSQWDSHVGSKPNELGADLKSCSGGGDGVGREACWCWLDDDIRVAFETLGRRLTRQRRRRRRSGGVVGLGDDGDGERRQSGGQKEGGGDEVQKERKKENTGEMRACG
jgi:hypothetical protein